MSGRFVRLSLVQDDCPADHLTQDPLGWETAMEIALAVAFAWALVLAAALGLWHDLTHRPRPERSLPLTRADIARARCMSNFYVMIHGAER